MSSLRNIIHSLQLGRATTAASDGGPTRTLQLTFMTLGNIISGITQMQHYGFASRPHAMSDHAVVALGNDPSKSISIASNDQRYQIPLQEGEAVIHDDQGQVVHVTRDGITILDKSGNTIVTSSSGMVLTDHSGSTLTMAGGTMTAAPKNQIFNVTGQVATTGDAGTGMTVDGNLTVTGGITATGDIVAGFGGADPVSVLGHTHLVTAVGAQTTAPTPGT